MSINSYAQNFEDVMLWRALSHISQGFYIDLGAQDPLVDSVSLAFHERGWRGIHVEPTPHYAELLRQQRLGDTVIQAAVGNGPAVLQFFEIADTGISTADRQIAAQHRERGFAVHEITVPCITLSAIFEACAEPAIHWLKIDVEGFEQQVLSSWGRALLRPWIVVVESTLPLTQIETYENWEAILVAYGYTPVYFDGLNRYYVSDEHPELKSAFLAPPNVFDGFTLNGTASAPFHQLIEVRTQEKINITIANSEQQKQLLSHEVESLKQSISQLNTSHAEHEQGSGQREQVLVEQSQQVKAKLEVVLRSQVQREQQVSTQLLALQQQAAQTELAHSQQLNHVQQDRIKREQVLSDQSSQTRQELEHMLRMLALREQEVAAQLRAIQQQGIEEKAGLVHHFSEREHTLQRQHVEKEQALSLQLHSLRQELEQTLRQLRQREQEVAVQLLAIQQQAFQEKSDLILRHTTQESELQYKHLKREEILTQQLAAQQLELRQLEHDRLQREKEFTVQSQQAGQVLERLLRDQVQRERDVAAELMAFQQQAEQAKIEQARQHSERTRTLNHQYAERERMQSERLFAAQEELRRLEQQWRQLETALSQEITILQSETQRLQCSQQVQAQQYDAELSNRQTNYLHLKEACTVLEAQLRTEIAIEQQTSLRLSQSLAEVQQSLVTTQATLTWRMTAPLRALAIFIAPKKSFAKPIVLPDALPPSPNTLPVFALKPNYIQQPEPIMPPVTKPLTPTPVSTLDELLACYDQQFVYCAFQALIGREPDPIGMAYYLGRLRTGFSKMRILTQLRQSPESKVYLVTLPGVDRAIQRYLRGQYPLIGWVFRVIEGTEGNSASERKLRGIENQLFLLGNESNHRFNQMEIALNGLHHLLGQQTQSITAGLGGDSNVFINDLSSGLMHLSLRTRDIYFQLKAGAAIHAKRAA